MIQLFAQRKAASVCWAPGIGELFLRPLLEFTGIEPEIVEALVEGAPGRQFVGQLPREANTLWRNLEIESAQPMGFADRTDRRTSGDSLAHEQTSSLGVGGGVLSRSYGSRSVTTPLACSRWPNE